jgi:WD40 repeat protein
MAPKEAVGRRSEVGQGRWGRQIAKIVEFTSLGEIVFYSDMLQPDGKTMRHVLSVCSVNGRYWRSESTDANTCVNVFAVSANGRYIATGDNRGCIMLRSLSDLKVVQKFESTPNGVAVTAIAYSHDQNYIQVGTQNGVFLIYAITVST